AHRHGAVGGRVHHGAALDAMLDQRERRRVHESGQRLGVELAREHAAARAAARVLGARGRLVQDRDHLGRAVRERGDHRGGGEQHVDHHYDFARQAHAVELLLAGEDVDLVVKLDPGGHRIRFAFSYASTLWRTSSGSGAAFMVFGSAFTYTSSAVTSGAASPSRTISNWKVMLEVPSLATRLSTSSSSS